ncbi:MAG: exopolysaccharide biosynthesis polyprenyl glycosylphosphotransferase [Candidatus Buchananbacteria bacterium]|nr:exopolysaccharide biosynthesis polyprenyl glycosylphosphotransferase [Candidatus Buchananbacteria bacterium]
MPSLITKTKKTILLIGDIGLFYLSLYLTLLARYGYPIEPETWSRHLMPFSVVFFAWLVVFFINDFYDLKTSYNITTLFNSLIKIFIINGAVAVAIFYFFAPFIDSIKPQRVLIIDMLIAVALIFIWRRLFYKFIKSSTIANRVMIIGRNKLSEELEEQIKRRPQLGYQVTILENIPEDLNKLCLEKNIDILVSALDLKDGLVSRKIFDCLSLEIDVYNINSFYEQITNKIPVDYIEHSWFLENLAEHSKKFYEIIKRVTDFIMAVMCLIISIFLAPLIALTIKLESTGPIIFKQTRTGKNGKTFTAMKFRSMVDKAEKNGAQWAQKKDPRVTRFGSFMRKTRIDEIPQLINILKGEMSFVGPRPERPEFIEILEKEIPFYKERLLVRPGLAGWAQLNGPSYGGSKEESLEKLKYDLYYIKNRSLLLDLNILLKTIKVVFSGRGQ